MVIPSAVIGSIGGGVGLKFCGEGDCIEGLDGVSRPKKFLIMIKTKLEWRGKENMIFFFSFKYLTVCIPMIWRSLQSPIANLLLILEKATEAMVKLTYPMSTSHGIQHLQETKPQTANFASNIEYH